MQFSSRGYNTDVLVVMTSVLCPLMAVEFGCELVSYLRYGTGLLYNQKLPISQDVT